MIKIIRNAISILLVVGMVLSVFAGCGQQPAETTPSTTAPNETNPTVAETNPTQPTESTPDPDDYILAWNVDRAEYAGKGADGVSSGRVPGSDTYIRVRFAIDGMISEYRVEASLANTIDSMDLMAIKRDKSGVVTEVTAFDKAVPNVVALNLYVEKVNGKDLTLNTTETLDGTSSAIKIAPATRVLDVSGESEPVGATSTLRRCDKIIAIANSKNVITHVFIVTRVDLNRTQFCPHCETEVSFTAWESTSSLPISSSGHYYLLDNVQNEEQQSMQANVEVILDLNGMRVDGATGKRVYSLHNEGCSLYLMDSSEAQTGKLACHGDITAYGSVVWLRYGNFTLYSGTLDGSDGKNWASGAVQVSANCEFNMYGGTITGGTTYVSFNETSGAQVGGNGGNVYVTGTFHMYGGEIIGGTAVSEMNGSEKVGGKGGNVYVSKNGIFEWIGGTISGGTADNGEADIHVHDEGIFTKPE